MLAGLIFATENAEDRPDRLAATLPFGGLTLLEFQARLLTAAGASHIVLVVSRMTPELLGASNRIGRRVATLDVVRTVGEVVEKIHPLARVMVIADGVATTAEAVRLLVAAPDDTLITLPGGTRAGAFERIGVDEVWAGLAIVVTERLAEVAALPREWSFQSALLRVAAQAGAAHVPLPTDIALQHDVERHSGRLAARGDAAVAALLARPSRWADRYVIAPPARWLLRMMIARGVATAVPLTAAGALTIGAFATGWLGAPVAAAVLLLTMLVAAATGCATAALRDETRIVRATPVAAGVASGVAAVAVIPRLVGGATGWLIALALVATATLVERAATERVVRRWWASPAALLIGFVAVAAPFGLFPGAAAATLYALMTLTAAVEASRDQP